MATEKKTANSIFQKYMIAICVACTIIIPLINNFALSLLLSSISGDIMLRTWVMILDAVINAIDTINLFLIYSILVNNIIRFGVKKSKPIIALCIIRIFIVYLAYLVNGAILVSTFSNMLDMNLTYCLTSGSVDLLLLIGAIILTCFLRSKFISEKNTDITVKKMFDTKNPLIVVSMWITVLIGAIMLSNCITNTISDLSTYMSPILQFDHLVYFVTPYIKWLFKIVIGYIVMYFSAKLFDIQWKNSYKLSKSVNTK